MLTVFTANFYSICHCRDMAITRPALSHRSQGHERKSCCQEDPRADNACADADHHTPCNEKDGCCGTHAVKFSLLEKQTAEPITLHPVFAVAFTHHFVIAPPIIPSSRHIEGKIDNEWLHRHSPPDFQALYQRFLI
ncbi:MAG TPA: hypothetical protein VF939_15355 [Puia sp.]